MKTEIQPLDLTTIQKPDHLFRVQTYLERLKKPDYAEYYNSAVTISGDTVGKYVEKSLKDILSIRDTLNINSTILVCYELGFYHVVVFTPHQLHTDHRFSALVALSGQYRQAQDRAMETIHQFFNKNREFLEAISSLTVGTDRPNVVAMRRGRYCHKGSLLKPALFLDLNPIIEKTTRRLQKPVLYVELAYSADSEHHQFTRTLQSWKHIPSDMSLNPAFCYTEYIAELAKRDYLQSEIIGIIERGKVDAKWENIRPDGTVKGLF